MPAGSDQMRMGAQCQYATNRVHLAQVQVPDESQRPRTSTGVKTIAKV